MRAAAILLLAVALRADEITGKMTARLAEEAAKFTGVAPQLLGTETLYQRTLKPPSHFHSRVDSVAGHADQWKETTIVSEYGFAVFSQSAGAIHELRQPVAIDGKKFGEAKRAQDSLAKAITASDDAQKRALLKEFEKLGLTS